MYHIALRNGQDVEELMWVVLIVDHAWFPLAHSARGEAMRREHHPRKD